MNLIEFRQNNPEHAHLSPEALSQLLYDNNPEFEKSGVSLEDFSLKVGVEEDRISRLPDRGLVSELGHAIPRGVREGYGMGLKTTHVAGKSLGLPEALYPSEEYIEEVETKTETDPFYMRGQLAEKKGLARDVISGVESAATSMSAMVPGAGVGLASSAAGGPISATVGTIVGAATSGGVMFGGGEYYDFIKTAEDMLGPSYIKKYTDQGHSQEDAAQLAAIDIYKVASPQALKSAAAEMGFEFATNIADLLIFKGGIKVASAPVKAGIKAKLKGALKAYGENVLKLSAVEVPAEMATGASQAKSYAPIYKEAGKEAPDPAEWAKEAIIPTLAAVGLGFAPVATVGQRLARPRQAGRQDTEDTQPQFTQEDLIQGIQGIKSSLDSGEVTPAQLREALKELPEDHIHAVAINEVLKDESPTARPIDLTVPKQTGADFLLREQNQEEIDKISRREETVEQLKQNLDVKLQAEEAATEEQYWQDSEAAIKQQQLERQIGLGREKYGARPTTVQQPVFTEEEIRAEAPAPEKTDVALEGVGATIEKPVEKISERIINSAIIYKGEVYQAPLHGQAIEKASVATGDSVDDIVKSQYTGEGFIDAFITNKGNVINRFEASLKFNVSSGEMLLKKEAATKTDRRTKQLKSLRIKEKRISQRRVDEIRRKTIGEMTEEEKGIALKYHELTGLQSKRAYNESEKKSIQVSLDVDALKWVNDTFGHDVAGNDLLVAVGKALTQTDIDSYHISGDEFYLQSDSMENVDKAIEKAYAYLKDNPLDLKYPDGTKTTYEAGFSYGTGKDLKKAETELQKHKTKRKLSERGAKPARGLGERTEGDEAGLEREDTGREVKPKKGFRRKKEQPSKFRTLRGAIKAMGFINFLNFKGELKDLSRFDRIAVARKNGVPIDLAVRQLREDNWLDPGTTVSDFLEMLRTDFKRLLSRDRLTTDLSDKKAYQKSVEEKKFEKELAHEPEAPPEGKYVQINAEDLPMGRKLTLLEGKSPGGWDIYQVTEKDPFSITLKDGIEIELKPLDKVEVLKKDLPKKPVGLEENALIEQDKIRPKKQGIGKGEFWEYRDEKGIYTVAPNKKEAVKRANAILQKLSEPAESIKPETQPDISETKEVAKEAIQAKPATEEKAPTDMFGQPVPTDMFGKAIEQPTKQKQERKTKEKRPPTQAQKPLFGEDKTQIQPELPLDKKPSEKDTLKTITAEMGKGLKHTTEVEVEETGEIVKITQDAGQALTDIDNKIFSYKQLLDCI